MRLSVDLSVDTTRAAVGRLFAERNDCCAPLSYRTARWWRRLDWRALAGVFEICRPVKNPPRRNNVRVKVPPP